MGPEFACKSLVRRLAGTSSAQFTARWIARAADATAGAAAAVAAAAAAAAAVGARSMRQEAVNQVQATSKTSWPCEAPIIDLRSSCVRTAYFIYRMPSWWSGRMTLKVTSDNHDRRFHRVLAAFDGVAICVLRGGEFKCDGIHRTRNPTERITIKPNESLYLRRNVISLIEYIALPREIIKYEISRVTYLKAN